MELINKHLDAIEALQETVQDDAEAILRELDLDRFIKDPEGYLTELADAFLADHMDEIRAAAEEGLRFAEEVLANT